MENSGGEQSSEKNISGRKRPHPHASAPDPSSSAGPTYHAAATDGCPLLTGSTAPERCTLSTTSHTTPTGCTSPTGSTSRTPRTGPTIPTCHTSQTTRTGPTIPTIPTSHIALTGPTSHSAPTNCVAPTGSTRPTAPAPTSVGHTGQNSLASPTGPTSRNTLTGPPSSRFAHTNYAAPTGPTSRNTLTGPTTSRVAPTNRNTLTGPPTSCVAHTNHAAPTGPTRRTAPDPPISVGHTGQNSLTSPTGPTSHHTLTGPPTSRVAHTNHAVPTGSTSRNILTGPPTSRVALGNRNTLTGPPTSRVAHTNRAAPTRPTSRSTLTSSPTSHSAPTGPIRPIAREHPTSVGHTGQNSLASPTGPTSRNTHTSPPTSRVAHTNHAIQTGPTSRNIPTGPAAPTSRAASMVRIAPTRPSGLATPTGHVLPAEPVISTSHSTPSSNTAPTGPAIQIGPTVSNGSSDCTGPTYLPLLKLQADHRSQCIIDRVPLKPFITREHIVPLPYYPAYEEYVIAAGLYGIHKIGHIPTDHALISALVERWRQETHTFHFPVGEMTITLQDAALLLGLRVDGRPICLRTDCNWETVVHSLLGRVDEMTFRPRSRVAINIKWLHDHFSKLDPLADDQTVQRFARAYCFVLVGSLLFTDHSGDSISAIYLLLFANFNRAGEYSWASGVLAYLYRELCLATTVRRKQFAGSVMLLQLWSWERLPMGRPVIRRNVQPRLLGGDDLVRRPPLGYVWSTKHQFADYVPCRVTETYRREIDGLTEANVRWLPYDGKMDLLPANCRTQDRELWRTTAPLIFFWIVEMHNPGRVARQFDRFQRIPPYLRDTNESLHRLINGVGDDWPGKHIEYLQLWGLRQYFRIRDQRPYDHSRHEEYMAWYSSASILYLTAPGGVPNASASAEDLTQVAMRIVERFRDVEDEDLRAFFRQQLHTIRSSIKNLLEPIIDESLFTAFDSEQPQQQVVRPVRGRGRGRSNRAPVRRARGSASTSR
ncbi:hypothetical protein LUZ63_012524 [Rhynchospora breviuscula]|uniref:Aminotransferase-like plant mobile domain-containing protein n=1 Tax=Rhynchospora breviuscula TaxID=2022672 RepID=A0A9Q0CKU3_9POAL|nr:hypothetical protein LUZ63_012524 [Rhynchospora breviuscula]